MGRAVSVLHFQVTIHHDGTVERGIWSRVSHHIYRQEGGTYVHMLSFRSTLIQPEIEAPRRYLTQWASHPTSINDTKTVLHSHAHGPTWGTKPSPRPSSQVILDPAKLVPERKCHNVPSLRRMLRREICVPMPCFVQESSGKAEAVLAKPSPQSSYVMFLIVTKIY